MPERSNGTVSKTVVPFWYRGFESLSFRLDDESSLACTPRLDCFLRIQLITFGLAYPEEMYTPVHQGRAEQC